MNRVSATLPFAYQEWDGKRRWQHRKIGSLPFYEKAYQKRERATATSALLGGAPMLHVSLFSIAHSIIHKTQRLNI
jgi:hypothetical protein